jgi:uncharacterized protein involved in exopolysaccharide biosynthesis
MEYEANRSRQVLSLLLTAAVVGGAMIFAFTAA